MLEEKIKSIKGMYRLADRHVSAFKRRSGISCVHDCGLCCRTGELEATSCEFLPAAYHLYVNGGSDSVLDRIARKQDTVCVFYSPENSGGHCSQYPNRGLICRLFGFSVSTNKHEVPGLYTCRLIKDTMLQPPAPAILQAAPRISSYYMRLYGIDPASALDYMPVNEAISRAIEQVSLHFSLRRGTAGAHDSPEKDEIFDTILNT